MRLRHAIPELVTALALVTLASAVPVEQSVDSVFTELRALKPMQPGQRYTVSVASQAETGPKELFLRRRTPEEVSASGLTCGCGDYALLFIARIEPLGFKTLLVDGAEISSSSLQDHFSGHAVVAIRRLADEPGAPWWLVDSTNLKILSRDWSPAATSFEAFGHVFWIGFCGPHADYPVHNPGELKVFYARTLTAVPGEFLNQTLPRLKYTVHSSLVGPDGKYLNPRLTSFLGLQEKIFAVYHVEPQQEATIILTRGTDNLGSDLAYSEQGGWVGHLGLQSGCSSSLLTYFEGIVRRRQPARP